MKVLSILILTGLAYGFVVFLRWFFKELVDFVVEAWHSGEAEQ